MVTTFDALADPTRRHILDLLLERPRPVGVLVDQLGISQPGVSKHLRVLRDAGLVSVCVDAQRRFYELRTEPLEELDEWLDGYRHLWEGRLDRLDTYFQGLQPRRKTMETPNKLKDKVVERVITRIFDARRELVYQAWIDPEHIRNWYGPQMFSIARCEVDPTPGGTYLVVMRGPDGSEYPSQGVFKELIENEKLVLTMFADQDADGNYTFEMLNTITFEDEDGKTRMTLRVEVTKATPQHLENLSGMDEGWKSAFSKLADYLVEVS